MQTLLGGGGGNGGAASGGGGDAGGGNSWYSDVVRMYKEGKFKTYARWLGVCNVFAMVVLTALLM